MTFDHSEGSDDRPEKAVPFIEASNLATATASDRLSPTDAPVSDSSYQHLLHLTTIERALYEGQFSLFYQPKLNLLTNKIDSIEALLRWKHSGAGFIPPQDIISVLEASGRVRGLTEWVIEQSIVDQRRLLLGGWPLTMYVNLSGAALSDPEFSQVAIKLAAERSASFGFEITETSVIANPAVALANLDALVAAGIKLAIDDYGAGLSSLAYLKRLPAHRLKIDKMFVSGMAHSHRDPLLVRSTIDLAHGLGLEVTAEGVESQSSLALLRVMKCDHAQGYLIARPMPIDQLESFLGNPEALTHVERGDPSLMVTAGYW